MNRRSVPPDTKVFGAFDIQEQPRFVERNRPFYQSRNTVNIRLKGLRKHAIQLLTEDWYHVLLRQPTATSSLFLLVAWTLGILVFAGIYMGVDYAYYRIDCGLVNPDDVRRTLHYGAYFAFSLQTTSTVGYTLPNGTNGFFENCPGLQVAIYVQMVGSMIFNAFLFAFFYARLAKVESRAAQVIFSKTAILSRRQPNPTDPKPNDEYASEFFETPTTTADKEDENLPSTSLHATTPNAPWIFSVRVADVDVAYPIVEAHARLYAKVGTQMIEMRILEPNDILGSCLVLSWPTTIRHEIDCHSPLYPQTKRRLREEYRYQMPNCGLNIRNSEAASGNFERYVCPICGEAYGSLIRLHHHVRMAQLNEANDKLPIPHSHRTLDLNSFRRPPDPTVEELKEWYPDEIIVVVEGVDPLTSGTFQALQSYTVDEVTWGGTFADCVVMKDRNQKTALDLGLFHATVHDSDEPVEQHEPC